MQTGKHDKKHAAAKEAAVALAVIAVAGLVIGIITGAYIRWMPLNEETHGWEKTAVVEVYDEED